MKIVTANLNGIRSATNKGFWEWFAGEQAELLCLQELKAHEHQIPDAASPAGYHRYYHFAEKPGYSGVALYSRRLPDRVYTGLGSIDETRDWSLFDAEGRFVMADFGGLSVISAYFPSDSSKAERQAGKMRFLEGFLPLMQRLRSEGRELVLCGDINIAHQPIDLKNWRGNRKNSGFLPEERAWFGRLLDAGFVDILRTLYPEREQYSWWSNRGNARANNVGWRIDYHLCSEAIAARASRVEVYRAQPFSDHAPITAHFEGLDDLL